MQELSNLSFIRSTIRIQDRALLLSKVLNLKNYEHVSLKHFTLSKNIKLILISDYSSIRDLIIIFFFILYKKPKDVLVYTFELYTITLSSLLSDFRTLKIRFILNFFFSSLIRLAILNIIIQFYSSRIIVCSDLRKSFIKKKFKNKKVLVLNNRLIEESNKDIPQKINIKNFFLIVGNINNEIDFEKLCKFCYVNNFNIIITAEILNQNILNKYSKIIKKKNYMEKKELFSYISNAYACCCFYVNHTLNQKYSASIKLYEYMFFDKLIIISDNFGVKHELKKNNYIKYIKISDLNAKKLKKIKKLKNTSLMSKVSFQKELSSLSI